jgi:hypothetical protein
MMPRSREVGQKVSYPRIQSPLTTQILCGVIARGVVMVDSPFQGTSMKSDLLVRFKIHTDSVQY